MNPNKSTKKDKVYVLHVGDSFITLSEYKDLINYIPQYTKYEVYHVKEGYIPYFATARSEGITSRGTLLTWTDWYAKPAAISKEFKTWLMVSGYSLDVISNS